MKESYSVQLADYTPQPKLSGQPALACWFPHVLKKWERIIAKVKYKYWIRTHMFGIRVLKTVEEEHRLDQLNGNYLFWESICKYINKFRVLYANISINLGLPLRVLKTVEEENRLDQLNGNYLFWESICKYINKFRVAFKSA